MEGSDERRQIAYSAAGIYGGAALTGFLQVLVERTPQPLAPSLAAAGVAVTVAAFGPRLPRQALATLGPLGALLIAFALSQTIEYGDGAILYVWPALWMSVFYGTRGAVFVVAWIGLVHGVALVTLPDGHANLARWIDVEMAVTVVVVVVRVLAARSERLLRRLAEEARVDPLTGLLNRRGFDERVSLELARALRTRSSLALVAFDLDRFKRVNDEYGHETGDRVLARVGEVIADEVRAFDVAARIGGEEFVVVLPDADASTARPFAERVRQAIGEPERDLRDEARTRGAVPVVTVSGGVACAAAPIDIERLLGDADRALYRAKHAGRDRIVVDDGCAAPA